MEALKCLNPDYCGTGDAETICENCYMNARSKTPNPQFCRKPLVCAKTGKCYTVEKYDRSCND